MESPVGTFPRPIRSSWNLDETVIETEVVSQGVLPSLRIPSVVRKPLRYEPIDLAEGQHLVRRTPDSHRRQRYVGIRRFLVPVGLATGSGHGGTEGSNERITQATITNTNTNTRSQMLFSH